MSRRRGARVLALGLAAAGPLAGMAAAPGTAAPTRGFYTGAQARTGAVLYVERCAMCHGAALEGTHEVPGLTGKFVANWSGRPAGDLAAYIGRAMPQMAPGSLAPDEAAALAAFVLQANGYPAAGGAAAPAAGTEPLPPPPGLPG